MSVVRILSLRRDSVTDMDAAIKDELNNYILNPKLSALSRTLLTQLEFFVPKDDSRYPHWRSFILTVCQNTRRELLDDIDENYDLVGIKPRLSIRIQDPA